MKLIFKEYPSHPYLKCFLQQNKVIRDKEIQAYKTSKSLDILKNPLVFSTLH